MPATPTGQNATEQAIRGYLNFLADPASAVNPTEVARLDERLAAASDPVEKLRLAVALQEAGSGDGSALEAAFVRDAKAWAETEGIPAEAFRTVGVSDAVLRRAGLLGRSKAPKVRRTRTTARSRRVTTEDLKGWALGQRTPFTIREITTAVGGSLVTAKKAIDELVAERKLQNLGPSKDHTGPGRAPARYAPHQTRRPRTKSAPV